MENQNKKNGIRQNSSPCGAWEEARTRQCMYIGSLFFFFFSVIVYEILLNKDSSVTAPCGKGIQGPFFPSPVCRWLRKRGKSLLERGRERKDRESVSETYYRSLHFGEIVYVNAPSAEKIHQRLSVIQCDERPRVFTSSQLQGRDPTFLREKSMASLSCLVSSSHFLRAEDKNHTSGH